MTIWLDIHLSHRVARWITATFGIPARSMRDMGFQRTDDRSVFIAARSAGDVVIFTKDSDLVDLVLTLDKPPQIVWLTMGNTSNDELQRVLTNRWTELVRLLQIGERLVEISDG